MASFSWCIDLPDISQGHLSKCLKLLNILLLSKYSLFFLTDLRIKRPFFDILTKLFTRTHEILPSTGSDLLLLRLLENISLLLSSNKSSDVENPLATLSISGQPLYAYLKRIINQEGLTEGHPNISHPSESLISAAVILAYFSSHPQLSVSSDSDLPSEGTLFDLVGDINEYLIRGTVTTRKQNLPPSGSIQEPVNFSSDMTELIDKLNTFEYSFDDKKEPDYKLISISKDLSVSTQSGYLTPPPGFTVASTDSSTFTTTSSSSSSSSSSSTASLPQDDYDDELLAQALALSLEEDNATPIEPAAVEVPEQTSEAAPHAEELTTTTSSTESSKPPSIISSTARGLLAISSMMKHPEYRVHVMYRPALIEYVINIICTTDFAAADVTTDQKRCALIALKLLQQFLTAGSAMVQNAATNLVTVHGLSLMLQYAFSDSYPTTSASVDVLAASHLDDDSLSYEAFPLLSQTFPFPHPYLILNSCLDSLAHLAPTHAIHYCPSTDYALATEKDPFMTSCAVLYEFLLSLAGLETPSQVVSLQTALSSIDRNSFAACCPSVTHPYQPLPLQSIQEENLTYRERAFLAINGMQKSADIDSLEWMYWNELRPGKLEFLLLAAKQIQMYTELLRGASTPTLEAEWNKVDTIHHIRFPHSESSESSIAAPQLPHLEPNFYAGYKDTRPEFLFTQSLINLKGLLMVYCHISMPFIATHSFMPCMASTHTLERVLDLFLLADPLSSVCSQTSSSTVTTISDALPKIDYHWLKRITAMILTYASQILRYDAEEFCDGVLQNLFAFTATSTPTIGSKQTQSLESLIETEHTIPPLPENLRIKYLISKIQPLLFNFVSSELRAPSPSVLDDLELLHIWTIINPCSEFFS